LIIPFGMARAIEIARDNDSKYKFGCVITDKRNHIIASAQNRPAKTHPIQARYAAKARMGHKIYLHAEIAALIACHEDPCYIYIARVWRDGTIAMAKPCPICELAIIESGIIEIYYTNQHGSITTVGVKSLNGYETNIKPIRFIWES